MKTSPDDLAVVLDRLSTSATLSLSVHNAAGKEGDSAIDVFVEDDNIRHEFWVVSDPHYHENRSWPYNVIPFSCLRKDVQEYILNLFN